MSLEFCNINQTKGIFLRSIRSILVIQYRNKSKEQTVLAHTCRRNPVQLKLPTIRLSSRTCWTMTVIDDPQIVLTDISVGETRELYSTASHRDFIVSADEGRPFLARTWDLISGPDPSLSLPLPWLALGLTGRTTCADIVVASQPLCLGVKRGFWLLRVPLTNVLGCWE